MLKPDKKKIVHALLFIALLVLFFSAGGLFVTMLEDRVQPAIFTSTIYGMVLVASLIAAVLCGKFILHRSPEQRNVSGAGPGKQLVFSIVLFIILVASTLVLLNIAASYYTVPWPMSGLHGVSAEIGKQAWGYHGNGDGFVRVNSWGQRDRDHRVTPPPGTYRMIFIGDSFLEDGAPVPLPYRIEDMLKERGRGAVEVINLGVSATEPDEYFFRLKRVGLPLQADHCVMMFSAGTDFIQEPSLLSFGGVSATYPRWSFLQLLGLNSLDQVMSNERRPVLRAWFKGGSLLKHELELKDIFAKTVSDQDTEQAYLSFFPPAEQAQLQAVLNKASASERSSFLQMLRTPDNGVFRSYYLDIATKVAKGMPAPEFTPAEYAFRWVEAAFKLCRSKGVRFTLVVIPDGFSVDPRLSGHYRAVADLKHYMQHKDDATSRFIAHASEAGMDVVDLRRLLQGHPGAYLNMDGHWSQSGADLVAAHLAEKFSLSVPKGTVNQ